MLVNEAEVTAGEKVELEGRKILTVYFTRVGNTDFADDVDAVFCVFPVWWGTLPKAVRSFASQAELGGKHVYVVATHGGSGVAGQAEQR